MSAEWSEESLSLATRAVHVPSTGEVRGRPIRRGDHCGGHHLCPASLGGVEKLTVYPAGSAHRMFDDRQLAAAGISRGTVRISTGIDDVGDIWADLQQALDHIV